MTKKNIILSISIILNTSALIYIIYVGYTHFSRKNIIPTNLYYLTKRSIFNDINIKPQSTLFIGDSLIDNCDWYLLFNNTNIYNMGIAGDDTDGLLKRLDILSITRPKKVFIMIGINDVIQKKTAEAIIDVYAKIIKSVLNKLPHSTIYINSILPTYNFKGVENSSIIELNNRLKLLTRDNKINYIDLYPSFTKGTKLDMAYSFDGLHLNGKGYQVWKNLIKAEVE